MLKHLKRRKITITLQYIPPGEVSQSTLSKERNLTAALSHVMEYTFSILNSSSCSNVEQLDTLDDRSSSHAH